MNTRLSWKPPLCEASQRQKAGVRFTKKSPLLNGFVDFSYAMPRSSNVFGASSVPPSNVRRSGEIFFASSRTFAQAASTPSQ